MTTEKTFTLAELNLLDHVHFEQALAALFEGPPWIVSAAWSARPFTSFDHLWNTLCTILYTAPGEQKIALIRAHPDLVGRAALAGTLSSASNNEQVAAGLDRLTSVEIATFTRLNQEYRTRFGFPFVICARENKQAQILAGFEQRLPHERAQEIENALHEIAKICAFRLHDLLSDA